MCSCQSLLGQCRVQALADLLGGAADHLVHGSGGVLGLPALLFLQLSSSHPLDRGRHVGGLLVISGEDLLAPAEPLSLVRASLEEEVVPAAHAFVGHAPCPPLRDESQVTQHAQGIVERFVGPVIVAEHPVGVQLWLALPEHGRASSSRSAGRLPSHHLEMIRFAR